MTDKKTPEWHYSNAPTTFSDAVNIALRADENIIFLQFMSHLPGRLLENHRTMMTKEDGKTLVENLAEILDYYPLKETTKATKKKVSKVIAVPK